MNKFIIIEGGCRGLIDSIDTIETKSSLQELANEYCQDNIDSLRDIYGESMEEEELGEFMDNLVADFGLDYTFYESTTNAGTIAVIGLAEDNYLYIAAFQESLFQALGEDSVESMGDAEELIGLEY